MEMTFDQYIANPMGVKNAVFGSREMYRNMYKDKLDKILVRESGHVKYTLYKSKNEYYIHFKIPSEVIDKFYYDTVIEFYTDKNELRASRTLKPYYVKFYSNDPSFVYTFAHAMKTNKMFITDLEPRMSKLALKEKAKVKNPKDEVGYVKSIFFAYLLMVQYNLFDKIMYETSGEKYNKKFLLDNIMNADEKIYDRQEAASSKSKKDDKPKTQIQNNSNNEINTKSTKLNKKISNVKNVKTIGKTKKTKRTKIK